VGHEIWKRMHAERCPAISYEQLNRFLNAISGS
jgi:hypothetical protein